MNRRRTIAIVLPEMTAMQANTLILLLDRVTNQIWDAFEPGLVTLAQQEALPDSQPDGPDDADDHIPF